MNELLDSRKRRHLQVHTNFEDLCSFPTNREKHSSNAKRRQLKLGTNLAKLITSKYRGPHKVFACWSSNIFTAAVSGLTAEQINFIDRRRRKKYFVRKTPNSDKN